MTNNKYVLGWIDEMAAMTQPDKIVWIDGSEEQTEALRKEACASGELEFQHTANRTQNNTLLECACAIHRVGILAKRVLGILLYSRNL